MKFSACIIWSFLALLFSALPSSALDCATDCNAECRLGKVFGRSIYDNSCKSRCEIYKQGCRFTNLPNIPTIPANPDQWDQAICKNVFEFVANAFLRHCPAAANPVAATTPRPRLDQAKQWLVDRGFVSAEEFSRVEIRTCEFPNGGGLAPSEKVIYIDRSALSGPLVDLIGLVAHEMFHTRQWRSMGEANFKCDYAKNVRKSGFGDGHPMESVAYEYEQAVRNAYAKEVRLDLDAADETVIISILSFKTDGLGTAGALSERYGMPVLHSPAGGGYAEFEFEIGKPGSYRLVARYAAAPGQSRPVSVCVDGGSCRVEFRATTTGWDNLDQNWIEAGVDDQLQAGKHVLRLHSNAAFPHITGLRFLAR